jgi:hypothetical protein
MEPVMHQQIKRVMRTFIDYPPRKRQAESYPGPISISAFQKFEWLRDELKKDGGSFTMPSGN